ncbi:MAG TPA: DUF3352 domain-containing protein, partial [Phycisphaerae bacterium]
MKRFCRAPLLLCAAVMATLTAGRISLAAPLDDRIPGDAIAYIGWAGAEALTPQYNGSNLKSIFEASMIKQYVNDALPKLIEQVAKNDPNAPKHIEKLKTGLAIAWQHPSAFYFCPFDFSNPQHPAGRFGIMCDAGPDAKTLADLLKEVIASAPSNPDLPINVILEGTTVLLTFGKADTGDTLKAGGVLSASPSYKSAMAAAKADAPAITVYADAAKFIAMVNDAVAKLPAPPEVKDKVPTVIEALGINGLTQIAYTGGFEGKGWADHAYVGMTGQRKGILTLFDNAPVSDSPLAMIPKDAASFAAWRMDFHKTFTEARNIIGKIDAPSQKQFDAAVAQSGRDMGLDIEKDILTPLGDEWALYQAPLSDEGGNSMALVQHLKDGPTFARTVAQLEKLFNAIPGVPVKIEKMTAAKTDASTLALGGISVAWTVKGDMLYVSSMSGLSGAIKQVENKGPSISDSDLYKAARARLPADPKPISISYTNPAKLYPEIRRTIMGYIPIINRAALDAAGMSMPVGILPPGDDVSEFMTPGASITWLDATGFHGAGKSAFPGAESLGGQQVGPSSVVVIALGAGLALPQMAVQRQTPVGNVDSSNLRAISQSTLVYGLDHKDQLPDDLARLVAEGMISTKQLVSRRAGTQPL